jgi:antitoxin YefM
MPIQTTYSHARTNLARLLDVAENDRPVIVIKRKGHGDVALISADELEGLRETVYLLQSPANAKRLLSALQRSQAQVEHPQTFQSLREEYGLDT